MIKQGDAGMKGNFATRIAGSADLYRVRATASQHCSVCSASLVPFLLLLN